MQSVIVDATNQACIGLVEPCFGNGIHMQRVVAVMIAGFELQTGTASTTAACVVQADNMIYVLHWSKTSWQPFLDWNALLVPKHESLYWLHRHGMSGDSTVRTNRTLLSA